MPRPLGLSELEGVVRDSKPDALVMLPARATRRRVAARAPLALALGASLT
jgi:hypothetical protein